MSDGTIAVGEWDTGPQPALAIHGLSTTHKLWLWTAAELSGFRLIAPDLRGRGASQGGFDRHYGISVHVEDMVTVLDRLGVDKAIVVGMSLGGAVAVQLAVAHPDRVEGLLLVDGGLPMLTTAPFQSMTRDQVIEAFRDRFQRVEQAWPDASSYRDFFIKTATPLLSPGDRLLDEYIRYDLVGDEPELRVRLDPAAVADDAADLFLGDAAQEGLDGVSVPVRLLYAEWGVGEGTSPGFDAEYLEPWHSRLANFSSRLLPGTDHGTTVMTASSGAAVAEEMSRLAS